MRMQRHLKAGALFGLVFVWLAFAATSAAAQRYNPSADWRLQTIVVSIDPAAELELFNPRGDEQDRLEPRVKGVIWNGIFEASRSFFFGTRDVVIVAIVREFDGLSTAATVLAGGEMRAVVDVWIADAETTEELTPIHTMEVSRITLGNVGGLIAEVVGGPQEERFARSVAASARDWLFSIGSDGMQIVRINPTRSEEIPADVALQDDVPETPPAEVAAVADPEPFVPPAVDPLPPEGANDGGAVEAAEPVVVQRSPIGGIGPEPVVVASEEALEAPLPPVRPVPEAPAAVETIELAEAPVETPAEAPVETVIAPLVVEPAPTVPEEIAVAPEPAEIVPETPADVSAEAPAEVPDEPAPTDADRVAVVTDPTGPAGESPTLANARWIGFTPAIYPGGDSEGGFWIAGPFDRDQRVGWITDTTTGATVRVTLLWREPSLSPTEAILSRQAAEALGLQPGRIGNFAVYLPR